MESMYLLLQNLTNLSVWELYLFPVPFLHEAGRISIVSPDNNLLSANSLTNGPQTLSFFSTLDVPVWVFVLVKAMIS